MTDVQYADAVRRERIRRGWSQREAARRGQVSNTMWSMFESYQRELTPAVVEAIARAYGWPMTWADDPGKISYNAEHVWNDPVKHPPKVDPDIAFSSILDRLESLEAAVEALRAELATLLGNQERIAGLLTQMVEHLPASVEGSPVGGADAS